MPVNLSQIYQENNTKERECSRTKKNKNNIRKETTTPYHQRRNNTRPSQFMLAQSNYMYSVKFSRPSEFFLSPVKYYRAVSQTVAIECTPDTIIFFKRFHFAV